MDAQVRYVDFGRECQRTLLDWTMGVPPFAGAVLVPWLDAVYSGKSARQLARRLRPIRRILGQAIEDHAIERGRDRKL